MKIWAEPPQEPLGQRSNYLLFLVPSGQGGGRSSLTRKVSAVECSFSGKEPAPVVKVNCWLPILCSERSELVAKGSGAQRHCGRGLGAQPPVGSRGGAPGGGLGGRSPPVNF